MRRVEPHELWIGHAGDAWNAPGLYEAGIRAIVHLAIEEPAVSLPRELISVRFPLADGVGNPSESLTLAIRTVAHLLELRIPTLVCCGAGMSRSPCIAVAAVALAFHLNPEDAMRRVKDSGPCDVASGLWRDCRDRLAHMRHETSL
jgi:hypothetical protein